MGLRKRPYRRRIRRHPPASRATGLLAATRAWEREQPVSEPDPCAAGVHAELRAAARLADTTDA
ncbi:hypothetical protein ACFQS1_01055 [Paractinoplanes rhizophilus]|uniref:Uncharacterized protein n=1 Tax=Paractinoplanes rhizophilus TaxID=1416877 RepID=A0ABW2HI28_9ACTN|nr:hypothetical protein [Actinoplanes sp.]